MHILIGLVALSAPEYLTEVVSPVYETAGSPADLARRAEACMSQHVGQTGSGPVILSSDPASGIVVASNALEYRDGMLPWRIRSRLTFEGRDGRFRLTHASIERHNDQSFGAQALGASPWRQVGKWRGSGWQKAEQALAAVSTKVAECVTTPGTSEDW